MSTSNLQLNGEEIRLSNVFRHHYVRSLSPQEKGPNNISEIKNFSLAYEPKNKEEIKSKLLYEDSNDFFKIILIFISSKR